MCAFMNLIALKINVFLHITGLIYVVKVVIKCLAVAKADRRYYQLT